MDTYSIQLIKVGQSQVRGPEAFWLARWDEWFTLCFYVLALRSGNRTILVNTGPPADVVALNRAWVDYLGSERGALRVAAEERFPAVLAAHGIDPSAVQQVIFTPIYAYTTGNLDLFPNAELCFSRASWTDLLAPSPSSLIPAVERPLFVPPSLLGHLVTDWWPRVRLLEDEDQVAPGIGVFRAGVHHRGSLAIKIATAKGTVVYSDAAYFEANVREMHPMGSGRPHEAFASFSRISREADVFLPGFDPNLLAQYPGGVVA